MNICRALLFVWTLACVLARASAIVDGAPMVTLLTFPWQTNCYDCKVANSSKYGVLELQSWLNYGVTEAQCRNLAATLDGNYTLEDNLTRNFFYTNVPGNVYSSCAVATRSTCSIAISELQDSNLVGNTSIFPTSYGDQAGNACSKNSAGYFNTSNTAVLRKAYENLDAGVPPQLSQVTDIIKAGSVQPISDQATLLGVQSRHLLAVNCDTFFIGFFKCVLPKKIPVIVPQIVCVIVQAYTGVVCLP